MTSAHYQHIQQGNQGLEPNQNMTSTEAAIMNTDTTPHTRTRKLISTLANKTHTPSLQCRILTQAKDNTTKMNLVCNIWILVVHTTILTVDLLLRQCCTILTTLQHTLTEAKRTLCNRCEDRVLALIQYTMRRDLITTIWLTGDVDHLHRLRVIMDVVHQLHKLVVCHLDHDRRMLEIMEYDKRI